MLIPDHSDVYIDPILSTNAHCLGLQSDEYHAQETLPCCIGNANLFYSGHLKLTFLVINYTFQYDQNSDQTTKHALAG